MRRPYPHASHSDTRPNSNARNDQRSAETDKREDLTVFCSTPINVLDDTWRPDESAGMRANGRIEWHTTVYGRVERKKYLGHQEIGSAETRFN